MNTDNGSPAMARRSIVLYTSDLSGKEVAEADQMAEIRVLDHPAIDHPVKLDAYVLEVASLQETKRDLVTLDLVLPGERPQRMVLDLADFDKLITRGDVQDVLGGAEELTGQEPAQQQGRASSRAAAANTTKRDPSQIQAIRDWARQNGYQVSDRGRIKAEIEQAYQDAHR
jgi:hypothetical protein